VSSFLVLGLVQLFVLSHQDKGREQVYREKKCSVMALQEDNAEIASNVHGAKGHTSSKIGIPVPLGFTVCEFNL
jgi:hypothetical protein